MNLHRVRNLYNCTFGREPDGGSVIQYATIDSASVVDILLNSQEYSDKQLQKHNMTTADRKHFDYCIVSVDERLKSHTDQLRQDLRDFTYHDLTYFDSSKQDYNEFYSRRGMRIAWDPSYSVMREQPLLGEFGICASQLLALEYMVANDIPEMIVLEDDVMLTDRFLDHLNLCYNDLPSDYDFLSDTTVFPNERFFNTVQQSILVGSDLITRSYLQNAHLGFMLYSLQGAKKILALIRDSGFFAPIDTMLFHFSRSGQLNGYSTFFSNRLIAEKDFCGSLIDEHNVRR